MRMTIAVSWYQRDHTLRISKGFFTDIHSSDNKGSEQWLHSCPDNECLASTPASIWLGSNFHHQLLPTSTFSFFFSDPCSNHEITLPMRSKYTCEEYCIIRCQIPWTKRHTYLSSPTFPPSTSRRTSPLHPSQWTKPRLQSLPRLSHPSYRPYPPQRPRPLCQNSADLLR